MLFNSYIFIFLFFPLALAGYYIFNHFHLYRAAYYNYYTGKTWGHSESYDLCIDSGIMGLERTGDFIRDFIKERFAK